MSFVWKKVDEKLKSQIERQAKKILDDFSDSLKKIGEGKLKLGVKRKQQVREEGKGKVNIAFRKKFLKLVPKEEKGYVVSEKGGWL